MSAFDVSASDLYIASALLGCTIAVSAWFAVPLIVLGLGLAVLEFAQ